MHLTALVALDAMSQGAGSSALLASLGRSLIVCECLCQRGYAPARVTTAKAAHAALIRVDEDAQSTGIWHAKHADYEALREAVALYGEQLQQAPESTILKAQLDMVDVLRKYWPQEAA